MAAGLAKSESGAVTSLQGTRDRLAALGEAYTDADTEVTVDSTRLRGRTATVQVTESTTLTYAKIRGDEPATTGFTAHHQLTFTAGQDRTMLFCQVAAGSVLGTSTYINLPPFGTGLVLRTHHASALFRYVLVILRP